MSQYPGGQPPQDPYYGQQQGTEPSAPPPAQQPSDPYFGQQPGDPYGQQPQDPWQAQQQAEAQAQQQAWYAHAQAQQEAWQAQQEAAAGQQSRGGTGAAVVGIFLVLLGIWFLFRDEIALDFGRVWPVLAVGLGIFMVIAAFIPRRSR
jgi:uncharacterized membrane protein